MIDRFRGDYRFLSNFWLAFVVLDGIEYRSVEHAYQAAKTLDPTWRSSIRGCPTPGDAKRMGRRVPMRKDWDDVKVDVMLDLLRQKFQHESLRWLLLDTGNEELVEGNDWGDKFWGRCRGEGLNLLGELLMQVRSEIRDPESVNIFTT